MDWATVRQSDAPFAKDIRRHLEKLPDGALDYYKHLVESGEPPEHSFYAAEYTHRLMRGEYLVRKDFCDSRDITATTLHRRSKQIVSEFSLEDAWNDAMEGLNADSNRLLHASDENYTDTSEIESRWSD